MELRDPGRKGKRLHGKPARWNLGADSGPAVAEGTLLTLAREQSCPHRYRNIQGTLPTRKGTLPTRLAVIQRTLLTNLIDSP
jgi:hypothetical protein